MVSSKGGLGGVLRLMSHRVLGTTLAARYLPIDGHAGPVGMYLRLGTGGWADRESTQPWTVGRYPTCLLVNCNQNHDDSSK